MANVPDHEFSHAGQYFYVNNCIGAFYRGVLDWFGDVFYPNVNYKVIGTYEKSVEFFNKKCKLGHEVDTNILTSITLDPTYDLEPADPEGKYLWPYQRFAPGLANMVFDRYKTGLPEQSISLTPIFTRYRGSFELIFWVNSVYELLDMRVYLFQFSGGYNRLMRPSLFESFIIVPNNIVNYRDYTNTPIDWSTTDGLIRKINNMNQDCFTMPVKLSPWFKFTAISDSSLKYGGDNISEYKLSATVEYEINIPTYMIMKPYDGLEKIFLDVRMERTYSRYGMIESGGVVPDNRIIGYDVDFPADFTEAKERAFYTFTEEDESLTDEWFEISNPFDVSLPRENILVVTYIGSLEYGSTWVFNDDKTKILIKVPPLEGDIVEFFRYEL